MDIGILGTGVVGQTLGAALIAKGHRVMLGSRSRHHDAAGAWCRQQGDNASHGMFEDAARFGETVFICLNGAIAPDALQQAGCDAFAGKVVVDVTNPLDFSRGMPPTLLPAYSQGWSLGEEIQQLLPEARVVKALNTVTARLMVDARLVNGGGQHLFPGGNDLGAKVAVKHLLAENFYWKPENMVDLGSITAARLTEGIIPFWVGVMQVSGTPLFNFRIVT